MKSPCVRDLQPNQLVTATFLVHLKDIRQKKTGEPYLSLLLGDRTGEIDAKMWDNVAEVMETFERDDFIKVKGLLQVYQSRQQLTVHKLRKLHDGEVDFADYFPASERDPEEMFAELRGVVATLANTHLRALLELFLDDPKVGRLYRTAPAAKSIHHAFLGGLLEHVLSLCRLCDVTAGHYSDIDRDLLLTGAVLHDIGKIAELSYERSFGYSVEGQLLGHIVIGLKLLGEKLACLPDFPVRLRTLLEHLLISHHGELEFGSPKVPLFPEALLLHHLDNLDSKMECMRALLAKDRTVDGCWTVYNSALNRSVLKRARYLEDEGKSSAGEPLGGGEPRTTEPAAAATTVSTPQPVPPEPPGPPRAGVAAVSTPAACSVSPFAEKLQRAVSGSENPSRS